MKSEDRLQATPDTHRQWMLVDDDENILNLLACLLGAMANIPIQCFQSSEAALRAFAAAPETFELVITDMNMPEMKGVDLCRRLHDLEPSLKVFLCTGSVEISHREALQQGFCGLLYKPVSVPALQKMVAQIHVTDEIANEPRTSPGQRMSHPSPARASTSIFHGDQFPALTFQFSEM